MHQPFDMDPDVASAIITIVGSFLVAWLTGHAQKASAEHDLSQALAEEQKRTGHLHEELIQVEDRLHDEHVKAVRLTDDLNSAIAYARQLGHYMDQVCARYGTFQGISKPRLPDDIRPQIEDTVRRYGWETVGKRDGGRPPSDDSTNRKEANHGRNNEQ